ncbi:MAG: hypothetical protein PUI85_01140, partial [Eubacteriales bacterium]|nr:hypothetical protein [Eubacteriales bacterium]
AADLQIAQYVKVTGDTVCGGTETAKTAVYNGQWTASIPMGKVMSSMESDMKTAANNGWYPHGKDGKNKIAYVEYTITFPEGVKIDDSNIDLKNFTSMFNSNGMSKAVNGQKVTLKFKLKDENWAGIYKHYLADGGANSTKTIDITIPYSVQANSLQEAKEIEKKQITARGEFETHASGGFAYSWTKVVKTTDVIVQSRLQRVFRNQIVSQNLRKLQ